MRLAAALLLLALPALAAPPSAGSRPARTIEQVKLLYFHAGWCDSCRKLDGSGVIERLRAEEPRLTIDKVNVDTSEALLDKYGVEVTPTFVLVDADGFPLGRPAITLEAPEKTLENTLKLVRRMTGRAPKRTSTPP
jgi:thiol-disulfide isomerase/thioredoxin